MGAFFSAAPVLTDTLTVTSPFIGTLTTQGITMPLGKPKTIEVDLFSDGDTNGPWMVTADDVVAKYYGSYGFDPSMSFVWDRTTGQNGEKLHVTITVTSPSIISGAHVFEIISTNGSRQSVWPGLVIEEQQ
jgi:hypothetical protein